MTCSHHGTVALPQLAALETQRAGAGECVAAALGAVQCNMLVCPAHAAREARVELRAQLLNGENGLRRPRSFSLHLLQRGRAGTARGQTGKEQINSC